MENAYKNFYRSFYRKTGGFIPTRPLNQNIYPGDFFQIRNGEMVILGNIFWDGIINRNDCRIGYGIKQNAAGWTFSDGVTKPYSGRGSGHGPLEGEFEFSKQILAFARAGSFFFRGNDPESVKIINWTELQQQLVIKLTQTYYSFREVYVITESATTADWTLAISSSENGELEIATDSENFGLVDIFGHHSARTIQSKDIEFYHREARRKPGFFKAKKLVVQDDPIDGFINALTNQRLSQNEWASNFFEYDFEYDPGYTTQIPGSTRGSVLDMLRCNELNPNTALMYFRWADASLDDVEKLLLNYGS